MAQNGQLMSGDLVVATIQNGRVTPLDPARMPLYLARGGDFTEWLISRAVDSSRPNSRILKKILRLKRVDDVSTVLHAHAATVTDNFWFRAEGEDLNWEKVRFRENHFVNLALSGSFLSYSEEELEHLRKTQTPELTNIGSFEKAWQLESKVWFLYKKGNDLERFSELFICRLGQRLGFDMAEYASADPFIKSRDFTQGRYKFDPAASIVGDSADEVEIYHKLKALSPILVPAYLDMIYLDALVFNVDRHSYNFGFLRSQETGEVLRMAPNFDNNIALIARGYERSPLDTNGILIQDFLTLRRTAQEDWRVPEALSEEEVRSIAAEVLPEETIDRAFVLAFVLDRQRRLLEGLARL